MSGYESMYFTTYEDGDETHISYLVRIQTRMNINFSLRWDDYSQTCPRSYNQFCFKLLKHFSLLTDLKTYF